MDKGPIITTYSHMVRELNLYPEPSFHSVHIDAAVSPELLDLCLERSFIVSDTSILAICRKGGILVNVGGISHTLSAGQMLIVLAGTWSRFSQPTPDYASDILLCRLSHESMANSIATSFARVKQSPVVSLMKQENRILSTLMEYAEASSYNHRSHSREEVDNSILVALRGELADIFLRRHYTVREASPDEQLVKRFNTMLLSECHEHRDVEFYAEKFGLSPKTFASKVRRVTGTTPSEIISSAVIVEAKRLLLNTSLTSAEIAEKLNFPTPSFFCRYFKRYTSATPQEWRLCSLRNDSPNQ